MHLTILNKQQSSSFQLKVFLKIILPHDDKHVQNLPLKRFLMVNWKIINEHVFVHKNCQNNKAVRISFHSLCAPCNNWVVFHHTPNSEILWTSTYSFIRWKLITNYTTYTDIPSCLSHSNHIISCYITWALQIKEYFISLHFASETETKSNLKSL